MGRKRYILTPNASNITYSLLSQRCTAIWCQFVIIHYNAWKIYYIPQPPSPHHFAAWNTQLVQLSKEPFEKKKSITRIMMLHLNHKFFFTSDFLFAVVFFCRKHNPCFYQGLHLKTSKRNLHWLFKTQSA